MLQYQGKAVFKAIAIGKLKIVQHREVVTTSKAGSPQEEEQKYLLAKEKSKEQLQKLYQSTLDTVGEKNAEIFEVHALMLEDEDLHDAIIAKIQEGNAAVNAVEDSGFEMAQIFATMEDSYMRARSVDIMDVCRRMVDNILGRAEKNIHLEEPSILCSSDFTPSEVVNLDKSKVLGFITVLGSTNSHTAILAKTLALPSVVNMRESIENSYDGKLCILDGLSGKIFVDPDAATLKHYQQKQKELEEAKLRQEAVRGKKSITKDGQKVNVYCNIGGVEDAKKVLENDGEGVGLFRSEFLFLESKDYPTEDFQFEVYKQVAMLMGEKLTIIRTMDIGADKQASYFNLPQEENPALGYRSIRICFDRPEIMHTQLRAIYRASHYGNIAVMVPMIIAVDEVLWVKEIAQKVQQELTAEGIPFKSDLQIGIMIETPAAALCSDDLAKHVDFFSIGSNDLTQYTLAVDRQNQMLEKVADTHHKAILRLIAMVVKNAHANGIWAGICGELAADLSLTEFFVGIGIDELSVSPPFVLPLREKICNLTAKNCNAAEKIV